MATATKEIEVTITLTLNEEEATYLRDMTEHSVEGELTSYQMIRTDIYNAIDTGLKKRK